MGSLVGISRRGFLANAWKVGGSVLGTTRPNQVMGQQRRSAIAGFQNWFRSEFPEAVLEVQAGQTDSFDHVCFDMNSVLHPACRRASSVDDAVLHV
ncbi:hypothetical protein T484DRAFT_1838055 [Baffinella frigidus]|nr:hypothetical protein T484DRAFT_1838055 [Cryptophyta sp. CCMP2293]